MIERIFYSALLIGAGILSLKYNFQIVNNTSRLEWIESKLGAGSTFLVYKLLSILLVLAGILYLTGFGPNVLTWLFSPLRSVFGN